MKKVMFAVIAVMLCLTVMAQDKPKFTVPNPEMFITVGSVIHNVSGDAMSFDSKFSTNFGAGGRVYALPKLSFSLGYTRDTLSLKNWKATGDFDYTAFNLQAEYWFMKELYGYVSPSYFTSPVKEVDSKFGYEIGCGLRSSLSKHIFINSQLGYLYVKDFALPQKSLNFKFAFGYAF